MDRWGGVHFAAPIIKVTLADFIDEEKEARSA
jgi:hypothetical protein